VSDRPSTGGTLLRDSGIYLLGNLLQKATAFVLIPLYTTRLTTAQYGLLDLAGTILNLALLGAALGVPSAINKCLHRDCPDEAARRRLLGTVLIFTALACAAAAALGWAFDATLARLLFRDPQGLLIFRYTLVWLVLAQMAQIPFEYFRASGRSPIYVALSLSQLLAQFVCTIVLVARRDWGLEGVLMGNLAGLLLVNVVGLLALLPRAAPAFDRRLLRAAVSYGVAMTPVFVSGWVVNLSDRFFLQSFVGLSALGIYALGYKFGALVDLLLVMPFQRAWTPIFFRIAGEPQAPRTLSRISTYLGAALAFATLGISLAVPPFLRFSAAPEFRAAAGVVPMVGLAYLVGGLANCFANGLIVAERVRLVAGYALVAAVSKLLLNLLLIPLFGTAGAALATALAFAVQLAGILSSLRRHYPVPVEWGRLGGALAAAAVPLLASLALPEMPILADAAVRLGLLLTYPALLLLLRLPRPEEIALLTRFLGALPARRRI
jgi:O-antigen/teichoic acid export membrane protein